MELQSLLPEDLFRFVRYLPRDVRDILKQHPGVFLAGGYLRSTLLHEPVNDIDLFAPSPEAAAHAALTLAQKWEVKHSKTHNAITVVAPSRTCVQFISRWTFDKPEDCLASFDFTICQAALWWEPPLTVDQAFAAGRTTEGRWRGACSTQFYPDCAARRLRYTAPVRNEDAGGSLLRVRKMLQRGYSISCEELAAVTARLVMGIDFDRLRTMGTDREPWVATVLSGLLREVDPLLRIDGFEVADGDELPAGSTAVRLPEDETPLPDDEAAAVRESTDE